MKAITNTLIIRKIHTNTNTNIILGNDWLLMVFIYIELNRKSRVRSYTNSNALKIKTLLAQVTLYHFRVDPFWLQTCAVQMYKNTLKTNHHEKNGRLKQWQSPHR